MVENAFLTAKEMAQDLVRQRVEPDEVGNLLSYLRDNSEAGGEAFLAYLAEPNEEGGARVSAVLRQACETHLRGLIDDVDAMKDVLGWGAGFMRYYRGEGNRPEPNRRPSQPRRRPAPPTGSGAGPRRPREVVEVTAPMESLQQGQMLQGTVRRVMPYGVFVAVGSERDGLVHVSELQDGFVGDPSQVVNVNDTVDVWVKSIDLEQKRISLTMKGAEAAMPRQQYQQPYQQQERQPYQQQERQQDRQSYGQQDRQPYGQRQQQQPRRERRDDRDSSSSRGSSSHSDGAPRRRAAGPRRAPGARLFEDEMPKEMTALGEALRRALAGSEDEGSEVAEATPTAERGRQSEELAEAHRRTLLG